MIVIPTGTDAPIYHWPYATVGLIVLNLALFLLVPPTSHVTTLDEDGNVIETTQHETPFETYALAIGDGKLHPVQWLSHNFLHYGFLHLAGNMLFLWAFGIVVEGKLGAIKYLLAVAAIGSLHGMVTQLLLMKSGLYSHAAGASAVVYGLLAACMIWAPRNELNCWAIFFVGFRSFVFQWDLYYTTVALIYIGQQILNLALGGAIHGSLMISELGHLSGAFWGTVVAISLLRLKLVDCEGWDIFSVWTKNRKLTKDWKQREKRLDASKRNEARGVARDLKRQRRQLESSGNTPSAGLIAKGSPEERGPAAVRRVHRMLEEAGIDDALAAYDKASRTLYHWPSQPDLHAMIKAFHAKGAERQSVRLMREHCRCFPEASDKMRLKLAQILINQCERPTEAARLLGEAPAGSLSPDLERTRQKLLSKAAAMIEEGVLELEGDD